MIYWEYFDTLVFESDGQIFLFIEAYCFNFAADP